MAAHFLVMGKMKSDNFDSLSYMARSMATKKLYTAERMVTKEPYMARRIEIENKIVGFIFSWYSKNCPERLEKVPKNALKVFKIG